MVFLPTEFQRVFSLWSSAQFFLPLSNSLSLSRKGVFRRAHGCFCRQWPSLVTCLAATRRHSCCIHWEQQRSSWHNHGTILKTLLLRGSSTSAGSIQYIYTYTHGTKPTTTHADHPPSPSGGGPPTSVLVYLFGTSVYLDILANRSLLHSPVPLVLRNGHDKRVTQKNVYAFKLRNVWTTTSTYAMVLGDMGF